MQRALGTIIALPLVAAALAVGSVAGAATFKASHFTFELPKGWKPTGERKTKRGGQVWTFSDASGGHEVRIRISPSKGQTLASVGTRLLERLGKRAGFQLMAGNQMKEGGKEYFLLVARQLVRRGKNRKDKIEAMTLRALTKLASPDAFASVDLTSMKGQRRFAADLFKQLVDAVRFGGGK